MPIPDHDTLGNGFESQLKAALDNVAPPSPMVSSARYRSATAMRPSRPWRFAPALIGVGAAGFALTAIAATGSPNPVIWTERAGAVLQSVGHFPAASPKSHQSPRPEPSRDSHDGTGIGQPSPSSGHEVEPSPEPSERPEGSPRPEPSPSPAESPEPSPTPDSSHDGGSSPTPSPNDPSGDTSGHG